MISIKNIREDKKITQDYIAKKLWITRQTFSKIEKWEVEPTLWQAVKLSEILDIDLDKLSPWMTKKNSHFDLDWEKYKQIITNFIKYASDSDWKITKTKLAKLCYLLDFSWYYFNLESITWLQYRRIQQWPVPDTYFLAIEEFQREEVIAVEPKWKAQMILNIEETSKDKLSKDELDLLKKISKKWKNKKTQDIVDFTHHQIPWKVCKDKEMIPYNFITQEEADNVY